VTGKKVDMITNILTLKHSYTAAVCWIVNSEYPAFPLKSTGEKNFPVVSVLAESHQL